MSRKRDAEFTRQFEGAEVLDGLLALADSACDSAEALRLMQEAHAAGLSHEEVIPELLPPQPRFEHPDVARRLFQNLLGLWDLVSEGKAVRLEDGPRPPRPRKVKTTPPAPFAPGEPDAEFVEAAWRYLEDDAKARTRLGHAFDNRQDALVGALDASGLSDEGYGVARHLLFEVHAMLELGWPNGVGPVDPAVLEGRRAGAAHVPEALKDYADEALFEAEQDEEQPLSPEELARVRTLVERGLAGLWGALQR